MPSPAGTNYERLFINVPNRSVAYDSVGGELDDPSTAGQAAVDPDSFSDLQRLVEKLRSELSPAEFFTLKNILNETESGDPGMSMDSHSRTRHVQTFIDDRTTQQPPPRNTMSAAAQRGYHQMFPHVPGEPRPRNAGSSRDGSSKFNALFPNAGRLRF